MNDYDFESLWKSSLKSDLVEVDHQSLLCDLSSKIDHLDKSIKKRNALEKLLSVLLIIIFCLIAYFVPYTATKIACLLMIPYYLYYMFRIDSVRKQKEINFSQSPRKFLQSLKKYIQKEKELLDTILYWAILPLALILILFYAGFQMTLIEYLGYGGFTLAILAAVFWANKYTGRKHFTPLLEKVDKVILEFDQEEQKNK